MKAQFPRGARVMVRFADHGPEHAPFEWTGRVLGRSPISGRIRVKPEYVTWRGPLHFDPADTTFATITRIAADAPIEYHEHRPNGRHVVREVRA